MKLIQVAEALDISNYPEQLNNISDWDNVPDICDIKWLEKTENTYHVLGKYYPLVYQAAQELQNDRNRYCWGMTVAKYLTTCSVPEARDIPMPARDGTLAGDFLPLLILLTLLPECIRESKRRKMPEDMIRRNLDHIVDGISIVEYQSGRPAVNLVYFRWLVKFLKVTLFNCYGFNFEVKQLPGDVYVLQHITSGALFPVFYKEQIHLSGNLTNSAGYPEADGYFIANITETEQEYIAYPCINGLVSSESKVFPKNHYRLVLQSGDDVLSIHIPRGTDISDFNARKSLAAGFKDALMYFPEHNLKGLYCHSWLLDPTLEKLLKSGANIPQFGRIFSRYPSKSSGKEVFSFVFRCAMPLNDLPENTSLERAVKQHYLNGNHILAFNGIVLPDQL